MIEFYSFGKLIFNGETYTKDLIILCNKQDIKVIPNWWRKEGHFLQNVDLEDVWSFSPEYLVVGTGANGCMKVAQEVLDKAKKLNIQVISQLTAQAVDTFNNLLKQGKKIAGVFHLTC